MAWECWRPAGPTPTARHRIRGNRILQENEQELHEEIIRKHKSNVGGTAELVWVEIGGDQEDDHSSELHLHLAKILHSESEHHDTAKLAQQLRALADQLESGDKRHRSTRTIHQKKQHDQDNNIEVDVRVIEHADAILEIHPEHKMIVRRKRKQEKADFVLLEKGDHRSDLKLDVRKFVEKDGERLQLHREHDGDHVIVDLVEGDHWRVHAHEDGDHRILLREKLDNPISGKIKAELRLMDRVDTLRPHREHAESGHGHTSEGDIGDVLRELRNEVRQLRKEVKEMRNRGRSDKSRGNSRTRVRLDDLEKVLFESRRSPELQRY